jgi:hypothetical protein
MMTKIIICLLQSYLTYVVAASDQNQPEIWYSLRHYDNLCFSILLITSIGDETFHVLEIKLHHAEERRGFEHLNYLHSRCAS